MSMYEKKCRKLLTFMGLTLMLTSVTLHGCSSKSSENQVTTSGREAGNSSEESTDKAQDNTKDKEAGADLLASMKEFSTGDGSVTISLNQDWTDEDLGVDFWLGAGSQDGAEAVIIMQFPKGSPIFIIDSVDAVKDLVIGNYGVADEVSADTVTVPGMTNVSSVTGTINVDGENAEAYILYGETDYAYYSLMYVAEKIGDEQINSMKASCSTFVETPLEEEDNTTVEITDTVRWFNASYAVLTEINGWDYNRFAGLPANESTKLMEQQSLNDWWEVTDRASADETLDWILSEGHRADFLEDVKFFDEQGLKDVAVDERADFIYGILDVTQEEAQAYANFYTSYEEFGEHVIDGWDYCRALNLASFYYLAGYYTEEEALDKSLEIAQIVQPLFESWDDLIASYMRGYEYWADESSEERQAVYEDLKTRSDNPYSVDFKTQLEKTW